MILVPFCMQIIIRSFTQLFCSRTVGDPYSKIQSTNMSPMIDTQPMLMSRDNICRSFTDVFHIAGSFEYCLDRKASLCLPSQSFPSTSLSPIKGTTFLTCPLFCFLSLSLWYSRFQTSNFFCCTRKVVVKGIAGLIRCQRRSTSCVRRVGV